MKKSLKVILFTIALCFIFTGCKNTKTPTKTPVKSKTEVTQQQKPAPEEKVITEPINKDFSIEKTYQSMEELLTENNLREMASSEIDEAYGLGKYKGLEKFVATSQSEETISEIAMIKLGESEQNEDILLLFQARLEKLKEKYANNPAMLEILQNNENVIVKQQASVAVMIISPNAKDLEARFDSALNNM